MLVFFLLTLMRTYFWLNCKRSNFISNSYVNIVFLAANISAIYSILVEKKATMSYFFEHQLTGPPFSIKIKPKVNFWLFKFPA